MHHTVDEQLNLSTDVIAVCIKINFFAFKTLLNQSIDYKAFMKWGHVIYNLTDHAIASTKYQQCYNICDKTVCPMPVYTLPNEVSWKTIMQQIKTVTHVL